MSVIKLSSSVSRDFWEIPVLFEDEHLLALNKPAGLLTSPDRHDRDRPSLMKLLHRAIAEGKPWAKQRSLSYLMNAHRLEFETSGVILLAKHKPVLVALANLFGSDRLQKSYVALVQGAPAQEAFNVEAKLAPHPARVGLMRVDEKRGKRSQTLFKIRERFQGYTLLECQPLTDRMHQIRVHLRHLGLPVAGDRLYDGRPLLLSNLKRDYRLKTGQTERPLISSAALHAEALALAHPVTGVKVEIAAPLSKDLAVSLRYLRRYATA
jgi:RluA family pseudouridine synthase